MISNYADQAGCPANVMIMGVEVWRTLRSFKKFRRLYDLSRGSESAAELACKKPGRSGGLLKAIWAYCPYRLFRQIH